MTAPQQDLGFLVDNRVHAEAILAQVSESESQDQARAQERRPDGSAG